MKYGCSSNHHFGVIKNYFKIDGKSKNNIRIGVIQTEAKSVVSVTAR